MKRNGTRGMRLAAIALFAALSWVVLQHWAGFRHNAVQELREIPVGTRVRLLGVVTYADLPGNRFWIEDETGAVAIGENPEGAGVRVGETVFVEATKTARYDPMQGPSSVGLREVRIRPASARVRLPAPFAVSLDNFPGPEKNGVRIEITGVLRNAGVDELGQAALGIAGSGFDIGAIVARPGSELGKLVNAEVRIVGVPEEARDSQGAVKWQRLWVPSAGDIQIVKAAPREDPLYTIRTLYAGSAQGLSHRVRLRGRVSSVFSDSFLLEDRWGTIACRVPQSQMPQPGAAIEAAGFPSRDGLRIDLAHTSVRTISGDEIDAADLRAGEPFALQTVRSVRDLTPAKAAQAMPVRVRGTITNVDPVWGQLYFQDETAGIYVKYSGNQRLAAGDKATLAGLSGAGDFAPVVVAPKLHVEGMGRMPLARPVTFNSAAAGSLDSQYVSIEGVVHTMKRPDNPQHPIATFELETDLGRVHVSTSPTFAGGDADNLDDAAVRIRGVFGTIYNSHRQIVGYQMLVCSRGDIDVLEPAIADPFSLAATPVGALLRFSPHARLGHRVKVSGTITMTGPDVLYVQDESGGVEVRGAKGELTPGEMVEVVGYPILAGRYSPVMTDAVFRSLGRRARIAPETTSAEWILAGHGDSTLVTVEGKLLTAVRVPSGATLVLQAGARSFTAQLDTSDQGADLKFLRNGSVLRVTGVCSTEVDPNNLYQLLEGDPVTFRILLRAPGDIVVVHAAPFWTPETALVLVGVFAIAILAILVWVRELRKRVRAQTLALLRAEETAQAIRDLSTAIQGVTVEERFDAQVSVRGSEEIAQVVIGFNRMLSELQERERAKRDAEAKLQHMALVDDLTGLPNRRLLSDRLAQSLRAAQREGRRVALLYIDLDGFKPVNDSLGHGIGDLLLKQVADRLRWRARESDTLARIGGDEFTVILSGIHSQADAEGVAESLLEALTSPFEVDGHLIRIGASIGISLFPEHGTEGDELLQQADFAMYAAKRGGKNRIVEFSADLGSAARERMTLEGELRRAVAEDEISIEYQAEFDLASDRIVRFEALARWNHPDMGTVSPLHFIPVAEEIGLIIPLGDSIMERACRSAAGWQQETGGEIQVAVNVSSVQFAQSTFVEGVREILQRTGLRPGLLQIELTESATLMGIDRAAKAIEELKKMGISLAMDDFGTGYSCLSYLPKLAFDAIKIDRSFVNELILRPETRAFVQSILAMAHNLGMKVIVEGIETEEQLELIRSLGADEAQGYLLGRPVADAMAQLREARSSMELASDKVRNKAGIVAARIPVYGV